MNLIKEFGSIFQIEKFYISERAKVLELKASIDKTSIPEFSEVILLGNSISDRDEGKVEFSTIVDDYFKFSFREIKEIKEIKENEYKDFISDLCDYEDDVTVVLTIQKNIIDNSFSIYCFNEFTNNLLRKNIVDIMNFFGLALEELEYLVFELYDSDIFFSTHTIFFVNSSNRNITTNYLSRPERISDSKDISHFYNSSKLNLLPEDFKIITSFTNNPYEKLFNKLVSILSLIYISTMSTIENDVLKVQISGQRNVDFSYNLNDNIVYNKTLYKIYSWIYEGGNLVDKALIARNILSLHCRYTDLINTDEKTFSSIQSNFNLYLKENVNQYLELKNKVQEYIYSVTEQVGDNVLYTLNNFKSNLITIMTFLFSVMIINIVSDRPLDNIFTKDITFILELFLLGSIIYLLISIRENKYKLRKIKSGYDILKQSYTEILSEQDLKDIFREDKAINDALLEVENGTKIYISIWAGFIFIAIILLEFISYEPPLLNLIINIVKEIVSLTSGLFNLEVK